MTQRTIRVTFADGTENHSASHQIEQAVGRMACWGRETDTITNVDIRVFHGFTYADEPVRPEIGATYKKADGSLSFYMAAIWNDAERKFSFHS